MVREQFGACVRMQGVRRMGMREAAVASRGLELPETADASWNDQVGPPESGDSGLILLLLLDEMSAVRN